jgi:hypothetical protein
MTCETVAVDTPDNLATSFILTPLIREAFPFSLRSVRRRNVGREEAAFVIPPLCVKAFVDQCYNSLPHMKVSFFCNLTPSETWLITPVESTNQSRQVSGTSDHGEGAVNCALHILKKRRSPVVFYHRLIFLEYSQTTRILPPPAQAVSRPPVHARNPIGQPPEVIRTACPSRLGTTLRTASVLPQ